MSDIIGIDAKLLAAFVAAAEELHFGRAAARMFMSQPPFSQLIKRLELQMQAQLFERTTRSVRLTPAGQAMLRHAQAVVGQMEQMHKAVRQAVLGEGGALSIGLTPTAACSPLAEKLYAYRGRHPGVELDLREMNSHAMEAALRQRVIDVAIMRPTAMDADLEVMDAFAEPMLLATRRDSDLAKRHSIGLDAISELPLIGYAKAVSPYFRQMVQSLFASIQQRPNVVQESVIPTVLTLVEAGVGVALVPWSITRNRGESLAFLRLSTRGLPKARIVLAALLKDRNPAVAGFLAALRAS